MVSIACMPLITMLLNGQVINRVDGSISVISRLLSNLFRYLAQVEPPNPPPTITTLADTGRLHAVSKLDADSHALVLPTSFMKFLLLSLFISQSSYLLPVALLVLAGKMLGDKLNFFVGVPGSVPAHHRCRASAVAKLMQRLGNKL